MAFQEVHDSATTNTMVVGVWANGRETLCESLNISYFTPKLASTYTQRIDSATVYIGTMISWPSNRQTPSQPQIHRCRDVGKRQETIL